jgi:hypothetical protein
MSMRVEHPYPDVPVSKATEPPCAATSPARACAPDPVCLFRSPEPRPLDWDQAVCVAAALLDDGWVLSETRCYPAVTGLVEELAAFLCAYGLLEDGVDRASVRAGRWPVVTRPTHDHPRGPSVDGLARSNVATGNTLSRGCHQTDGQRPDVEPACHAPGPLDRFGTSTSTDTHLLPPDPKNVGGRTRLTQVTPTFEPRSPSGSGCIRRDPVARSPLSGPLLLNIGSSDGPNAVGLLASASVDLT